MAAENSYHSCFSGSSRIKSPPLNISVSDSPNRTAPQSRVIILLLILCIIIGLVTLGFVVIDQIADTSSEGIDVVVQLAGNDVQVTLLPGGKVNQITGLNVYVDGHSLPNPSVVHDPLVGSSIQFAGVAKDVTGYAFIIVDAEFLDGTQRVIKYARMRCS